MIILVDDVLRCTECGEGFSVSADRIAELEQEHGQCCFDGEQNDEDGSFRVEQALEDAGRGDVDIMTDYED